MCQGLKATSLWSRSGTAESRALIQSLSFRSIRLQPLSKVWDFTSASLALAVLAQLNFATLAMPRLHPQSNCNIFSYIHPTNEFLESPEETVTRLHYPGRGLSLSGSPLKTRPKTSGSLKSQL